MQSYAAKTCGNNRMQSYATKTCVDNTINRMLHLPGKEIFAIRVDNPEG